MTVVAAVVPRAGVLVVTLATVAGQVVGAVLLDAFAPAAGQPLQLVTVLGAAATVGAVLLGSTVGPHDRPGRRPPAVGPAAAGATGRSPLVCAGVLAGLGVVVVLDRFRRGTLVMAAAVLLGAWLRVLLPERQVGLLRVRGRAVRRRDPAGARAWACRWSRWWSRRPRDRRAGGYGDRRCLDAEIPRPAKAPGWPMAERSGKVTVVGAGFYGSTTAQRLAEYDVFDTVVLTDIVEGKPEGLALDLNQSRPIEGFETRVVGQTTTAGRRRATRRPPARTSSSSPPACRASPA